MGHKLSFILLLLFPYCSFSQTEITLDSTILSVDTIITGLDIPWEITMDNEGKIWMTERIGLVSRIDPESGDKEVLLDLRNEVIQQGESGLLGMVLHPSFHVVPNLYLVYTYSENGIKEKLVRYTFENGQLKNPMTIIDGIPGNSTHDGSRLWFDQDDSTVYMTTGDAQNLNAPQDIFSLNGKVLRFNADGTIPDDNPIPGSPVWSIGHRNAQGLVYVSSFDKLYSSEHGPDTDDELNILQKNKNYGWPDVRGYCDTPSEIQFCNGIEVTEPIYAWTPTIATSDLIWYDNVSIPEFSNSLLLATLKNKEIIQIRLSDDGTSVVATKRFFSNRWGRIRDILQGPEGEIYLATNGASWSNTQPGTHSIIRLKNKNSISAMTESGAEQLSISVYPNPGDSIFNVVIPGKSSGSYHEINVYRLDGSMLNANHIEKQAGGVYRINLNDESKGLFIVRVKIGNQLISAKLIKK